MRWMALAILTLLSNATVVHATECVAVDENDLPRSCTFSERLGQCGYEAWQSWKTCVDPDDDGLITSSGWEEQLCNFFSALDLAACAVEVPFDILKSV